MFLPDVSPHAILPKDCLPAVACSVFHIYTICTAKLCNGEERKGKKKDEKRDEVISAFGVMIETAVRW